MFMIQFCFANTSKYLELLWTENKAWKRQRDIKHNKTASLILIINMITLQNSSKKFVWKRVYFLLERPFLKHIWILPVVSPFVRDWSSSLKQKSQFSQNKFIWCNTMLPLQNLLFYWPFLQKKYLTSNKNVQNSWSYLKDHEKVSLSHAIYVTFEEPNFFSRIVLKIFVMKLYLLNLH